MGKESENKAERILSLYTRLQEGKIINKEQEANDFSVSSRTIQRDISDIQCFLNSQHLKTGNVEEIIFSKNAGGYILKKENSKHLEGKEILATAKVLLESRSLMKAELFPILQKLIGLCEDNIENKMLEDLIRNEMFHYVELQHGKNLLDILWLLEQAVKKQQYLRVTYKKLSQELVTRKVKPVGLMFADFYFYLTAYIDYEAEAHKYKNPEDGYPTIYRVDRFLNIDVLDEHFSVPYAKRFEEGEFRKRVQFMQGGKLEKVQLECQEQSLEAVLDRLPSAEVISQENGKYIVKAEVFGKGAEMWIEGQNDRIQLLT